MYSWSRFLFVCALSASVATGARADYSNDTYGGLLNQFNEIVFGNVTSGSETEGRAVIGGNLTQSGAGNYCFQSSDGSGPCATSTLPATTARVGSITVGAASQSFGALNVYGNVSGNTTGSRGNIFIGGGNTGQLSLTTNSQTAYVNSQATSTAVGGNGNLVYTTHPNGITPASQNGTVSTGSFALPSFATTFQNPLTYLSTYLSGLTGINQGTSNSFNATPTTISGTAVTVYNVLGSNLPVVLQNASFNLNGATTVVINVTGAVGSSLPNLNTFTGQNNVIWNFVGQTSLSLPGWAGTILAPTAALTLTGVSQGDVVAASLIQGANEIHNYAFTGSLAFVPASSSSAVPEPAGLVILALGAAALVLLRRGKYQGIRGGWPEPPAPG